MSRKTADPRLSHQSFRITRAAATQILRSARSPELASQSLRIAVKRRPDGTLDYAMGFDEADDTDTVLVQHNVEVLIGVTSLDLLAGALLDYVQLDVDGAEQFVFLNPNDPEFVPPDAEA